jgi:hypothetical protein
VLGCCFDSLLLILVKRSAVADSGLGVPRDLPAKFLPGRCADELRKYYTARPGEARVGGLLVRSPAKHLEFDADEPTGFVKEHIVQARREP